MVTLESFREKYGIHFTTNHNGKMSGMASLSTSVLLNPYCQMRASQPGTICEKCYAERMAGMYKPLARCLATNTEVLISIIIPVDEWPLVNYAVFRLEAFGDVVNTIQVINYFNFCRRNPRTTFSLWTKNPGIVQETIDAGNVKTKNLIVIQSSELLNVTEEPTFPCVDKVFTVFDQKTIDAENIIINCGARNCATCRRCYTKKRKVEYINEKLHK